MATNTDTTSGVKYQPKFGRVLIRREVKEKTSGGIIIPSTSAKLHAACEGVIEALGETAGITESYDNDGERIVLRTMKVGDKVIFGRYSGSWLNSTYNPKGEESDDGTLFICQDQDILAVME